MKEEIKTLPKATHQGSLDIADITLNSYVLEDGTRVLNRIEFLRALGRTGKAKGGRKYDQDFKVPVFLSANNLKPYINNELTENSTPLNFKDLSGNIGIGYKAELLPAVCNVFLDANDAGVILKNQKHIVERCKLLIRAFATVGIIALVDEATGYQEIRDRLALQKILDKYILDEYRKWTRTFPPEFYKEMFKLKDWPYDEKQIKRPSVIGHYTNNLVYKRLAPGVLKELQSKNPKTEKGYRKQKHTQWLTGDVGVPKLREHLIGLIALMKAAPNWKRFTNMVERVYPKYGDTIPMDFEEEW